MISTLKQIVQIGQKDQFVGRLGKVLSGSLLGQLILLSASPILSRIYDPSDFGVLSFYQNVISILAVFVTGRFELAVPAARSPTNASSITLIGVTLSLVISISLIAPLAYLWYISGHPEPCLTQRYWYFLPIGSAMLGIWACLSAWAAYHRSYRAIGRSRLFQSVQALALQLGCSLFGAGPVGLLGGSIVGQAGGAATFGRAFVRRARRLPVHSVLSDARDLSRFALIASLAGVVGRAAVHAPLPIFLMLYGPDFAGQVFLGQRLLSLPTVLIGRSVALPIQQAIGRSIERSPHQARSAVLMTTFALSALGALFVLPVILFGPAIFDIIFGSNWRPAGQIAQLLVPMYFLQIVAAPFAQTLAIANQPARQLAVESGRLVLVACSILVPFALALTTTHVILCYSIAASVAYAGYISAAFHITKRSEHS